MAKELPYFKFYINEWMSGDITLESYELQGLFISICSYYWSKDCNLSFVNLNKKFRGQEANIEELIKSNLLKKRHDFVRINFLDEQLASKEVQSVTNRINGMKGGRPPKEKTETKPNGLFFANRNETETEPKANPNETNIEKSRLKNNTSSIDDRKLKFSQSLIPFVGIYGRETIREFCDYWTEPTKSKNKFRQEIEKTWDLEGRLRRWAGNDFNKNKTQHAKGATDQSQNVNLFK